MSYRRAEEFDFDPNGASEMRKDIGRYTVDREDNVPWYEHWIGRVDRHNTWKPMHTAVRVGSILFIFALFSMSWASVAHDNALSLYKNFDLNTDFLTDEGLVLPARVAQQINTGHDQHFRVSAFLATITTIDVCIFGFAFLVSWISAMMYRYEDQGRRDSDVGGFFYTIQLGFQFLFSTPSETNTSMWLNLQDVLVTPFLWVGFMMLFGVRSIYYLVFVGFFAAARGALFFSADEANGYEPGSDMAKYDLEGEDGSFFWRFRRIIRVLRWSGFLWTWAATVCGWVIMWIYITKFPSDQRPAYYYGIFITCFVLELLHVVVIPAIYYGLIMSWSRHDAGKRGFAFDVDRYNVARLFTYYSRLGVFVLTLMFVATREAYVPRWGFIV